MLTLLDIVQKSAQYLNQKGIDNPRRQAEEVISDTFNLKRLELYTNFERPLTEPEIAKCRSVIERRGKREPYQYISGAVEFLGCKIAVTTDVLIPRQETEILTDKIIQVLSKEDLDGKTLWDVCCGSGCIGIAIKKRFPKLNVILSDLSEKALLIAKKNALTNEVNVSLLHGDLLTPFAGQKADFFVCNPPYIAEYEYVTLDPEVKDFEPKQALISGPTGLEFYSRLSAELPHHLQPGAKAWLEMGYQQSKALKSLFLDPQWKKAESEKDWSGKERFFLLEIE
jgi:release factor glutamine methyltransferase